MAEASRLSSSIVDAGRKRLPRRKPKQKTAKKMHALKSDRLDSLPWGQAVAGDDPIALLSGGVEGGFFTLEEIDEAECALIGEIPELGCMKKENSISSSMSKKRKHGNGDTESKNDGSCVVQVGDADVKQVCKKQKERKKSRSKVFKNSGLILERGKEDEAVEEFLEAKIDNMSIENAFGKELLLDEDEVCAWNELRLHPILIKSIRRLGFREPTPIQKACIPVAAHQGKDVIGAAQTGSGKTLAFGLPILQRLLEEQDKARSFQNGEATERVTKHSHLRVLILVPTRELALQVSDHLRKASRDMNIGVVSIVGGMYSEKQERLLKRRPEIVVATPGRLWELMSGGNDHLVELHSLSFLVLDEADRMIETGHFNELQSIIDMLPTVNGSVEQTSDVFNTCKTIPNFQRKKRQTFVFSATVTLSENFRKKLKFSSSTTKSTMKDGLNSIEKLSERAGMRPDVAIVDLTNTSIVADKLVESFIECGEEDKEAYLYYILSVHCKGRTVVFCTSIAALRRISSFLHLLNVNAWTLHAQMQQRARLKAMDRFHDNEHGVLIATDVAARGLDIPGIRTVIHYQLPHSAEIYIHRSGRTARASGDGCSIALIAPSDQAKFSSLCKSLSKETLQEFHVDTSYMPDVIKRLSLARQIDKIQRKSSQEKTKQSWFKKNAAIMELAVDDTESEEERVMNYKHKKTTSLHLKKLQQELNGLLARPLQPKAFSRRFFAGAGLSLLVQQQLEELCKPKLGSNIGNENKKKWGLVVIGQGCVEPLQALRNFRHEVCVNVDKKRETRRLVEKWKIKQREVKKREREHKRKERKKLREGTK